jgi:hypothetical protein
MFKDRILNYLLPKLIAKKSPYRIPRSGEEAKSVNCFTTYLGNDGQKPTYLVDGYNSDNKKLEVLALDESGNFTVKETINLLEALKHTIEVHQYYGLYAWHYNNLYDLLFNRITRYDELKANLLRLWDTITQSRFNKKELVTKKTIELLTFLVDNHFKRGAEYPNWNTQNEGIGVLSLMKELYGIRWVNHPNSNSQRKKLELYLDSLFKNGDLSKNDGKYYVTGKALKTLEGHEENERRHKDTVGIQRKILWLTFIIAFAALIQAKLIILPPILKIESYNSILSSLGSFLHLR